MVRSRKNEQKISNHKQSHRSNLLSLWGNSVPSESNSVFSLVSYRRVWSDNMLAIETRFMYASDNGLRETKPTPRLDSFI